MRKPYPPPPPLPVLFEVLKANEIHAESFAGRVIVCFGGKTGETLYGAGCMPALRRVFPQARLVLRVFTPYLSVTNRLREDFHFDCVEDAEPSQNDSALPEKVGNYVARCNRLYPTPTYDSVSDTLFVSSYSTYNPHSRVPFYRAYLQAAGVDASEWEIPVAQERREKGDALVACIGANHHSPIRVLPLPDAALAQLAGIARESGLDAVALLGPADGDVDALAAKATKAGFRVERGNGVDFALDLLQRAQYLVGLNSGIVFAHRIIGPVRSGLTMIDSQRMLHYNFSEMPELMGPAHQQLLPNTPHLDERVLTHARKIVGIGP